MTIPHTEAGKGTAPVGIEMLTPDNHALYLRVQTMLNMRCKYEHICDNLGLVGPNRVNELCEWFIAYKTPKAWPMVNSMVLNVPARSPALIDRGVRLQAWKRQRDGARNALKAAGL